jgi:uncharacterized membrane protein YcaP (DUF421 family)
LEHIAALALGLGQEAKELAFWQMGLRAIFMYMATLLIVRMGKKRFMGRATAFDLIVGIMLGSIASRAITGNAPLFPTLAAAAMIMALHWIFSAIAVRWHWFGRLIKGRSTLLIKDGEVDEDALCGAHMTSRDLAEALREAGIVDLRKVAEARLERGGQMSVIRRTAKPHVVSVEVSPRVQTVRLEIE